MASYFGGNNDDGIFDSSADLDFILALQIQMQADEEDERGDTKKGVQIIDDIDTKPTTKKEQLISQPSRPLTSSSLSDPDWELIDPCPDVHSMFIEFDRKYFWSRLGSCRLEWSKRMTICAGIFYLREGGVIRLSEPLLKYRPRRDLVDTLLHEMIHAYLYLTRNFKDRGSHGPEFLSHAERINRAANSHITVYHSFHDEVNHARQHIWRCNGVCRTMRPFYGYVKRSMNRAPSKNDLWWAEHQAKCKGTFEKISEPEPKVKPTKQPMTKSEKKPPAVLIDTQNSKLDNFFKKQPVIKPENNKESKPVSIPKPLVKPEWTSKRPIEAFFVTAGQTKRKSSSSEGRRSSPEVVCLDDSSDHECYSSSSSSSPQILTTIPSVKMSKKEEPLYVHDDHKVVINKSEQLVECPVCFERFCADLVNLHVNSHF